MTMENFGQPPYGPFDDPQDDPLYDPFDIFADPFEASFNAPVPGLPGSLGPPAPLSAVNFQEPLDGQGNLDMNNFGMLDSLEETIENSPPIPPALGFDDLDTTLSALEDDIENTSIPPELETEVELFNDPGWGHSTPSIDTPSPFIDTQSPLQGIHDRPAKRSRDERSVRRSRGTSKNKQNSGNKVWCPVEEDYVSPETCEDKDCEHYNPNTHECMYNAKDSDL